MAGTATAPAGKKVSTAKGGKKKVVVKVAFFGFVDHTGKAAGAEATPIDLAAGPLKIKQMLAFIPPADAKGNAAEEADAYLSIWEMKGEGGEKGPTEMLRIAGKVKKADGYNFRPVMAGAGIKIDQQAEGKPFFKQAGWAAAKKTDLVIKAKLELEALDGAKTTGEFILPPLEYDEKLELQLGGGMQADGKLKGHEAFAVGQCKISHGSFAADCTFAVQDDSAGVPRGGVDKGNLDLVVVHCMSAIFVADVPSGAFDVPACVKIFKDNNVSAHYIIDRDGSIHQCVDVHRRAPHAGGNFNVRSIGIELMGYFDGAREVSEKKYENAYKGKKKLEEKKAAIQVKRAAHVAAKAAGKTKVLVGGVNIPVDQAIAKCDTAIAELDTKINNFDPGAWAKDWEENVLVPADTDGVPLAFKYTDAQYKSLGELMKVIGRRFGYNKVASHHKLAPTRKTDPGIYFEWGRLTPSLLPGKLSGDESSGGGRYGVE